jgi:tRNA-2-methylthio-N6-dimethylallyladenosine synthase
MDVELAMTANASPVIQYVTIMRGCNYNCSYCIVPSVRGREIYRPVAEILTDVEARTAEGAKEIWLLGQTVNSYRPTEPPRPDYDFADLLRDVSAVAKNVRIRFISPHPYYLSEKLVRAMAETSNVCEHIHLPAQSGSNAVLKRMKRNYTRESYMTGIKKLREAIPNIVITTDIIVGFPGETEEDFQETLTLVKEANFDSAYCFKYSPRPGTASAEWGDDVSDSIKESRVNLLLEGTEAQGRAKAQQLIGTHQEVLIEEDKGNGWVRGKTRGAWRVRLKDSGLRPGDTVTARITETHSRELHAEAVIPAIF